MTLKLHDSRALKAENVTSFMTPINITGSTKQMTFLNIVITSEGTPWIGGSISRLSMTLITR